MRKARTHPKAHRRSPALQLDPYSIDETTITLEEWRRAQQPVRPAGKVRRHTPHAA